MRNEFQGARIWLSGAVPKGVTARQGDSILQFVTKFSSNIFEGGGHILHGAHPSLTPALLEVAGRYIARGGRKDCLTIAVSRFWSKAQNFPTDQWRKNCLVYETSEVDGDRGEEESLRILRQWMSARSDAFVSLGGKWWDDTGYGTGISKEISLAMQRGLPCFLLGGFGAAVGEFLKGQPQLIRSLKNGLSDEDNAKMTVEEEVEDLVPVICHQLARLPLVHGRVSDGVTFRILALDGGGIKGAYTASVLATLEDALQQPIAKHFDLIAGTSTGGILGIGLGMGLGARDILRFYRDRGNEIFPSMEYHSRLRQHIMHFFQAKHSQSKLYDEIKKAYFGNGPMRTLESSLNRLVIPAYDSTRGICHIFRTPHHKLFSSDRFVNAAEAALATAAAPTYFSAATVIGSIADRTFIDGGIWANSPALAAILEAVCYLDVPVDRIDVLSVGTTTAPVTFKKFSDGGLAKWNLHLISLFSAAQIDASITHASQLVTEPRFLRINCTTRPGQFKLDDARNVNELVALGNADARMPGILSQVSSRFLNGIEAVPWVPVSATGHAS